MQKEKIKADMKSALEHFKKELSSLRTSRANPDILENVVVEAYGSKMKMKEVCHVTAPEARMLLIRPFDANNINAIRKAIEEANLNLQPVVDGDVIRIVIQPRDESIRKKIAKECKKKAEETKVIIRDIRRKYKEKSKKEKEKGEITEDILRREEKIIQEETDNFCKEIDELSAKKEKEILEI